MPSLYYHSGDIDGLSSGILEILERTNEKRDKILDIAKNRALDFSWDSAFLKTMALFKEVVVH